MLSGGLTLPSLSSSSFPLSPFSPPLSCSSSSSSSCLLALTFCGRLFPPPFFPFPTYIHSYTLSSFLPLSLSYFHICVSYSPSYHLSFLLRLLSVVFSLLIFSLKFFPAPLSFLSSPFPSSDLIHLTFSLTLLFLRSSTSSLHPPCHPSSASYSYTSGSLHLPLNVPLYLLLLFLMLTRFSHVPVYFFTYFCASSLSLHACASL